MIDETTVTPTETAETAPLENAAPAVVVEVPLQEAPKPKLLTPEEVNDIVERRLAKDRAARRREQQAQPAPVPPSAPVTAPDPNNFPNITEYVKAESKFQAEQMFNQAEESRAQAENARQMQTLQSAWETKTADARQAHSDFDDVTDLDFLSENRAINPVLARAIMRDEKGPELMYQLGKNLREAQRIAQLPPEQALLELGTLRASLIHTAPKPKPTTSAPPPPTPLAGAFGATLDPSRMSDADYLKHRQAEYKAKRGGR